MFRKVLNKILLKYLDFDALLMTYQARNHRKLANVCNVGPRSQFYIEANINNLQQNREKIAIGSNTHVRGHLQTFAQGGEIVIGNDCYIGENSRIWSASAIRIGNRVLIAHNVNIHDNISHPLDKNMRHKDYLRILGLNNENPNDFDLRPIPIEIADDVWIGFNATILKGVKIGCGSIVGAGSIVLEDVPEDVVVAGNPAKIIKRLAK